MQKVGLYTSDEKGIEKPVPLQSLDIHAHLVDFCAQVTIKQTYKNNEEVPIEATFMFPVEDGAAIIRFEAIVDGKRLVGKIEENEEAQQIYDDAISQGSGAYMLEQVADDVFQASVGNLPPQKEVSIVITFVTELKSVTDDKSILFHLPTSITPRYTPFQTEPSNNNNNNSGVHSIQLAEGSELPYRMNLSVDISMQCAISKIEVPNFYKTKTSIRKNTASVQLQEATILDKDFSIQVYLDSPHTARSWVELTGSPELENTPPNKRMKYSHQIENGDIAVMLSFFPDFAKSEVLSEFIFVIDRSGSMRGQNILDAKQTMIQAMEALPSSCKFNIVGFGSSHELLFAKSVNNKDKWKKMALDHINHMSANLGGTELLKPLKEIFSFGGYSRQIFLLTDGAVSNMEECIEVVRKNANTTRVFTFGIGSGVSTGLVKGIGEAGKGFCELVMPNSKSDSMQKIVMRQLKRALQPALTNVSLDWVGADSAHIKQAPTRLPPIFGNEKYIVYAFVPPSISKCEAVLKAQLGKETVEYRLTVNPKEGLPGNIIHSLAARSLIRELESGDRKELLGKDAAKKEAVLLSKTYGIACEHTSFVVVEERGETQVKHTMEKREVPSVKPPAPVSTPAAPSSSSGSYGGKSYSGGSGPVTRRRTVQRNEVAPTKGRGIKRKRNAPGGHPVASPFGFKAWPAPDGISDTSLVFLFKGPKNTPAKNCWLDAVLGLLVSIPEIREFLTKENHTDLLCSLLSQLFRFWVESDHTLASFRKGLNKFHLVWNFFETNGYTIGKNHNIISAFLFAINRIIGAQHSITPNWTVVELNSLQFARNLNEISQNGPDSLILINQVCSPVANSLKVPGYDLHSFVAYEEIGKDFLNDPINHFYCIAPVANGFWILDDLLDVKPGGYQGGLVSCNMKDKNSCKLQNSTLESSKEQTPLMVFRRTSK